MPSVPIRKRGVVTKLPPALKFPKVPKPKPGEPLVERTKLTLPNNWAPRDYQVPLWNALDKPGARAIAIWHRRAGKDDVFMHKAACSAFKRPGVYWHMLPEAAQARKAIWTAINPKTGKRRIDEAFPLSSRKTTRENEMSIEFINGALWQVVGSDNFNSLVGSPPVGVCFSEWALANPLAWTYIRPILAENGGFAGFITTPRGRNHASKMYEAALKDPAWFAQRLTAHDTGVFSRGQLDTERNELIRELGADEGQAMFDQEYMVDFAASVPGAFWGRELAATALGRRTGFFPPIAGAPCFTSWDIGFGDTCVVWIFQPDGLGWRIVGCIYGHGAGLDYYVRELHQFQARHSGIIWGGHIWPHDGGNGNFATGETYKQTAEKLGIKPITVLERSENLFNDINTARQLIGSCVFNTADENVDYGFTALQSYVREWDEERKVFKRMPLHNWASHFADSFRYLAVGRHRLPRETLNKLTGQATSLRGRMPVLGGA